MKVLFLSNIPSPYRMAFFNELGKVCKLTVVFEGMRATDRNAKWKYEEVRSFECLFLKGMRTKSDQFICPGVIKVLKEDFDIIIVGGYSTPTGIMAIEYLRKRKKRFFIEADGGFVGDDNLVKLWLKKHLISSADAWLSSGEKTTDYLTYYGAKRDKVFKYPFSSLRKADVISSVPVGVEKMKLREQLGIVEKKIIIAVGQFIPRKGFDLLLQAMDGLPTDIGLYLIGDEPTEEYLNIVKKLGQDNIHFLSFMSQNELKCYYQAADVFVLPTREDIWGLVINEAMANGLPIITTDRCVAGLELIKSGENGYIVPINNIQRLQESIKQIFEEDIDAMGKKSLEIIDEYTIENMVEAHMIAFQSQKQDN